MRNAKWWTPETMFVAGMGVLMSLVFGAALFARLGSSTGSSLVPADKLEQLRDRAVECQTITDEEATGEAPRFRC